MKLGPHVDADGRARVCGLCAALVVLSQGVPFIHAGDDLLRSKSLDRDSYKSGRAAAQPQAPSGVTASTCSMVCSAHA